MFFPSHVTVEEFSDVPVAFTAGQAEPAEAGSAFFAMPFDAVIVTTGCLVVEDGDGECVLWFASANPTVPHAAPRRSGGGNCAFSSLPCVAVSM